MSNKAPHELVAQLFMEHKGYVDVEPVDVEKLDGEPCWYFVYTLEDATLELEVWWSGSEWETLVTSFSLHDAREAI